MDSINSRIAEELGVRPQQVEAAVALLDEGSTVPFIARYRKEVTGSLDDTQLRHLEERLRYLRELDERRISILASIEEQGKLTPELARDIKLADTKTRLEDLYLPYKQKRRTKGQIALEAGLGELADGLFNDPGLTPESEAARFVDAEKGVADVKAALEGAKYILMERFAEDASLLERFFVSKGYRARAVPNTEQMDRLLGREVFNLVVLDLMLPGEDGLTACRRLRSANNQIPIIMLTAKGDELSRIKGLELGADDYLAKPFNPDELMARVKAVLRRQSAPVPGAPGSEDENVTFGDYELSLATRELKRGAEVHMLTTGEFAVLKALVMNARQPLTRDKLMNLARGREWDALERSIDVQISRLRRMIEPDPSKPRYIQTVWGVGYVFVPDGTTTK
ncbi:two-component system response regulator OmpR [Pseudomonas chlororaphis]|uniref:osmolarity response regulator transcription factor OmpR n=1 Tax=Pseudomonas chlororaphis TaxID=587753 RepID=UPI001B31F158|nr:two-component system response regulator OmpR [Pseudomonas chlororaphis]